jgi:hypothetical protein
MITDALSMAGLCLLALLASPRPSSAHGEGVSLGPHKVRLVVAAERSRRPAMSGATALHPYCIGSPRPPMTADALSMGCHIWGAHLNKFLA